MGLDVNIKGFEEKTGNDTYSGGYMGFALYRRDVAKAFDKELGELYEEMLKTFSGFEDYKIERMNEIMSIDEGVDLFLCHSDCDGKFSVKECKVIYESLSKIEVEHSAHELWLEMFEFCWKNRVIMEFC